MPQSGDRSFSCSRHITAPVSLLSRHPPAHCGPVRKTALKNLNDIQLRNGLPLSSLFLSTCLPIVRPAVGCCENSYHVFPETGKNTLLTVAGASGIQEHLEERSFIASCHHSLRRLKGEVL